MEHPPTDNELVHARLQKMSACWATLASVHDGTEPEAATARLAFVQRYQRAAYHFLLGVVRDADVADELFQEVVLRFVRGEFQQAEGDGRLRDDLQSTLTHLVHQQERPEPVDDAVPVEGKVESDGRDSAAAFLECWRDEMLDWAWEKLAQAQRDGGPPFHSVLQHYAENSEANASDVALQLTVDLDIQPALTAEDVRKLLQQARQRFADHLLDEVARSLRQPGDSEIEMELAELDLLRFCRGALSRRQEEA